MLNKCFLTGRPTNNPVDHEGEKGRFVTFSLAVNGRKNKDGTNETMFIDCVLSNEKQCSIFMEYIKKGSLITVVGRLYQNRYTDRNGLQHSKTSLSVEEFEMFSTPDNQDPVKEKVEDGLPF